MFALIPTLPGHVQDFSVTATLDLNTSYIQCNTLGIYGKCQVWEVKFLKSLDKDSSILDEILRE